jgi:NADH dehydrogenase
MLKVLVTGGTGWVGRQLLPELVASSCVDEIRCLVREPTADLSAGIEPVVCDLAQPEQLDVALADVDLVLHLASATGKAHADECQRVNVEGTRALVEAALHSAQAHFVFVSSIAVTFEDLRRYPYGRSKRDAETILRESGLRHTILRPTILFGAGSPVLDAFTRLACTPLVMPLFGSGRTRVQPLAITDLVRALIAIVEGADTEGCIEVGGPEVIELEELLRRIRHAHGVSAGWPLRIPARPLAPLLAALEPIMLRLLPFTAGQLATFMQDGVARPNRLLEQLAPLEPIASMLSAAIPRAR